MKYSWMHVNPKDRYVVLHKEKLSDMDHKVIQYLYQPLVGGLTVSLYLTLMNEVSPANMYSKQSTHRWLMDITGLPLDEIYQMRSKLEGIGLMKVWKKTASEGNMFIYELLSPLSPNLFFRDDLLPLYLKQKVDERHFDRIVQFFSDKSIPEDFQDITLSFSDVFESTFKQPDELANHTMKQENTFQFFSKEPKGYTRNFVEEFDFELLFSTVKNSFVSRKAFTPLVIETIATLAYLYKINVIEMSKLVLRAQNEHNEIDTEELKKYAREYYLITHGEEMPALVERKQPEYARTITEPKTPEERLLYTFETTSPLEFLMSLSNGALPSEHDLAIVEKVMGNQKLPPGVVNVLLHYVMLKSDMKLNANYVETIASHWSRKNISTVREAYEMALQEHKKYQKWAEDKKTKKSAPARRTGANSTRKEMVPDWMKQEEQAMPDQSSAELAEKAKRIKEKLQGLSSDKRR